MKYLGIALAHKPIFENHLLLPEKTRGGATERFDGITSLLPKDKEETLIICTAGYSKKEPYPNIISMLQNLRKLPLCGQIHQFVQEYRVDWLENVLCKAMSWGTESEIVNAIKLAQEEGFISKDEKVKVVVASNLTHLPRIKMYLERHLPESWSYTLVWAKHKFTLLEHVLEPIKYIRDVFFPKRFS